MTLQWVDWLVLVPIAAWLIMRLLLAIGSLLSFFRSFASGKIGSAAAEYQSAEKSIYRVIGCALSIALYWKFLAG